MMLRQKQSCFVRYVGKLFMWAHEKGYELTIDKAYRPPYTAAYYAETGNGSANSLHCLELAIDLNLFIDGKYQTKGTAYQPLGEFWEHLDAACCWGGRFHDYRHFSYIHGKRK